MFRHLPIHRLRFLTHLIPAAIGAPPFLLLLAGCTFNPPEPAFNAGSPPREAAIFCDIELGRRCPTSSEEISLGVDIAHRDEDGFWLKPKGIAKHGLDYSPAAMATCGGMPQIVEFKGAFPDGTDVCLNASVIGDGQTYGTVADACKSYCEKVVANDGTMDLDGKAIDCSRAVSVAHRADVPFPGACTAEGMLRGSFEDPRRQIMNAVEWANVVNATATGNTLTKTSATTGYDAGAAASRILEAYAEGVFEFIASESTKERTAGFAVGPLPDNVPSDADIAFGVVLASGGVLRVTEAHQIVHTTTYAPGQTIRMAVIGGRVYYFRDTEVIFKGAAVGNSVLRVSVSLKDPGATIASARTSF